MHMLLLDFLILLVLLWGGAWLQLRSERENREHNRRNRERSR